MTSEQLAYIERESERARYVMIIRRLITLCVILALLAASAVTYIIVLQNQYQCVVTEQEVEQQADGDGYNSFVGGDYYGNPAS